MKRRLRSWMFVPGNIQRFLDKAADSSADALFLDLEDGVLPEAKELARDMVAHFLAETPRNGPARFVRVNGLGSPWIEADLQAVVAAGADGVCIPKVEEPEALDQVSEVLGQLSNRIEGGDAVSPPSIIAAIESAKGLIAAPAIAQASPLLLGLMFGGEDFALDLGLGTRREAEAAELIHPRASLVVAASAARILSIDGVFPHLDDAAGFERDVLQARRLGFDAKSTFNPRQIEMINEVFTPQPDELDYARRVVAAFDEAERSGEASVAVGGQLVDLPIVMRARRLLESVDA